MPLQAGTNLRLLGNEPGEAFRSAVARGRSVVPLTTVPKGLKGLPWLSLQHGWKALPLAAASLTQTDILPGGKGTFIPKLLCVKIIGLL